MVFNITFISFSEGKIHMNPSLLGDVMLGWKLPIAPNCQDNTTVLRKPVSRHSLEEPVASSIMTKLILATFTGWSSPSCGEIH
ncbi:hypothetical protein Pcinc_042290 [Petrolisthes cinctipes]|uniref:Uncharacterized protein n=1 Tax=Petrolisthes cinctipes TaxID=88211 RepID=A0AAE1BHR8_PETCI|nr:hypothetical protein Pcinc_042290 [Petrolisthes cinctipes]